MVLIFSPFDHNLHTASTLNYIVWHRRHNARYFPLFGSETCIDMRPLLQPERWNCQFTFSFITARCIMTGVQGTASYQNKYIYFTSFHKADDLISMISHQWLQYTTSLWNCDRQTLICSKLQKEKERTKSITFWTSYMMALSKVWRSLCTNQRHSLNPPHLKVAVSDHILNSSAFCALFISFS